MKIDNTGYCLISAMNYLGSVGLSFDSLINFYQRNYESATIEGILALGLLASQYIFMKLRKSDRELIENLSSLVEFMKRNAKLHREMGGSLEELTGIWFEERIKALKVQTAQIQ